MSKVGSSLAQQNYSKLNIEDGLRVKDCFLEKSSAAQLGEIFSAIAGAAMKVSGLRDATPSGYSSQLAAANTKTTNLMLSYSWAQQPAVLQISDLLKQNGYSVWIDTERMSMHNQ